MPYSYKKAICVDRHGREIIKINKTTIVKSNVDLIEIFQIEGNNSYILEIIDFGHDMRPDYRIIPNSRLQEIIENINDQEYCNNLMGYTAQSQSTLFLGQFFCCLF